MYGSKKPEKEPYLVTSIIKMDTKTGNLKTEKPKKQKKMLSQVKLF